MPIRTIIILALAAIGFKAYAAHSPSADSVERPFGLEEELHYKIYFGWFTIGKGRVRVKSDLDPQVYKVEAEGRTVGLLGIFANLEDEFSARIEKSSLKPIEAERRIKDGRYWKNQRNKFNYEKPSVHINVKDFKDANKNLSREIKITHRTLDILSSYLYLRSVDWSNKQAADSVMISTFYGEKVYDFGVEYAGKERIKFEGNRINTHKLYVLFPKSRVFPHERAVTVWISADKNQLPLKITAKLGIGKSTVVLYQYRNLHHPKFYFKQNLRD